MIKKVFSLAAFLGAVLLMSYFFFGPSSALQYVNNQTSASSHRFIWYNLSSGNGLKASGTHVFSFTSVGQVFTDKTQSANYTIYNGYISTPAPPPVDVKEGDKDKFTYTFDLFQNYPNPFNPETEISYYLPEAAQVRLTVYNVLGRKVRTLVDEYQTEGQRRVHWDGKDDSGSNVASGIYFYRLDAAEYNETKKMVLMR